MSIETTNARAIADIKKQRMEVFAKVGLYPVTCERYSKGRSDGEVLNGVINGGAKIVQLRDKISTKRRVYEKAVQFRKATRQAGVLLIVNDHLDIAVAVNADGVHLGQSDFPAAVAKRLFPQLIVGVSTHSLQDALKAENDGADYINIGPVFPTRTKKGVERFLGLQMIRTVSQQISIPFTVMGGINAENLDKVLEQGARKVAMITAITMADDISKAVAEFGNRIAASY